MTDIEVIEISEDSDAWLLTGPGTEGEVDELEPTLRAAIDAWLVDTVGSEPDMLAESREKLAATRPIRGKWWFGTGHLEGEVVDVEISRAPKEFSGVIFL